MKTPHYLTVERLGFALLALAATGALYSLYTALRPEKMLTIAVRQGVESVALKKVAERFSREHGVTVKIEEFPYDELFAQEREQLRFHSNMHPEPKSAFDVVMVDDPWMPGLLIDPTDTEGNDPEKYRLKKLDPKTYEQDYGLTDFAKSALSVASYCAKEGSCNDYYGVPFVGNSQIFCYNADDIQDIGVLHTWDQVKEMSNKLQDKTQELGYVTRIGPNNSIVTDFMPILWAYDEKGLQGRFEAGVEPFGKGKEKEASMAFQTMVELVRKQKAGGISVDDFDVAAYLARGRASMGIVWSAWAMSLMSIQSDQKAQDAQKNSEDQKNAQADHKRPTLKCAGMPGGKPELGVWLLAIPRTAAMPDEAEEFIKYATSKDQLLIAAAQGNPPPRKSVLREPLELEKEAHQDSDQDEDSEDLDCSRQSMRESDYSKCMARIRRVIHDRYVDLFPTQLKSLEAAQPRPRSRCWTEMEKVLGNRLQQLILLDANNSQQLSQAAAVAVSQAKQDMDSLTKRKCWESKRNSGDYH
ncbi:MAG TPA: extracellular solute-binding protein [Candidatus Dormibacteraeota bacterium]|jgi:multiple sugar transport system substrate-binding protein|nr:extracellular solute-binding protein [Candidatus Dormibacteraeota bacterium]